MEKEGIRQLIDCGTNKTTGIIINPKVLGIERFEEIIKYAAQDSSPRKLILMGGPPCNISDDLLKEIGKLPEEEKNSMISTLADTIPDNVGTVVLYSPKSQTEQFVIKKPTTQELTLIFNAQKNNQEAWLNTTADLPTGKTRRQIQLNGKIIQASIATLRGGNPFEELINTEIVVKRPSEG